MITEKGLEENMETEVPEKNTENGIPEELPYAVNTTQITDEINKKAVTRMMRKLFVMNLLMILGGIASGALLAVICLLRDPAGFEGFDIVQLVICILLAVMGVLGLVSAANTVKTTVKNAPDRNSVRKTSFYDGCFLVETGEETALVPVSGFVKMVRYGDLLLFYFKPEGDSGRTEVFFVSKEGFEDESQAEKVLETFGKKKKRKN